MKFSIDYVGLKSSVYFLSLKSSDYFLSLKSNEYFGGILFGFGYVYQLLGQ
jgi:hypothetical protein